MAAVCLLIAGCGGDGGGASPPDGGSADGATGDTGVAGPRVLVESAAGRDELAALTRFLTHAHQWEVEGLVFGDRAVVRPLLEAYRAMLPPLRADEASYPDADRLLARTLDGEAAVGLVLAALRAGEPLWYLRWGQQAGQGSVLATALDRLKTEESPERYRRLLSDLQVVGGGDRLEGHRAQLALLVDTAEIEAAGAAALATVPGFDLQTAVIERGGALGALYPVGASEQAAFTFLYLMANGLGPPHEPRWSTWAGSFVPDASGLSGPWTAAPTAAALVQRFAPAIQNDFAARLQRGAGASGNRPPRVVLNVRKLPGDASELEVSGPVAGNDPLLVAVLPGRTLVLDASASTDPDGQPLGGQWWMDATASTFNGPLELSASDGLTIEVRVPESFPERQSAHLLLAITDAGTPPLTRYRRMIFTRPR